VSKWLALGLAVVLMAGAPVHAEQYPAPPGFKGKIGRTGKESVPDWPTDVTAPKGAPNVLIWMVDDLGFGQLGTYGGLIDTPTLDKLAQRGLRYTNFNTTAICTSSRASLLTGRNHHMVANGSHIKMPAGYPGYNGRLPRSAATMARVLQQNGYTTFALGKWDHLPAEHVSTSGPFDYWPSGQGFDHYYGFLAADDSNFEPSLWEDHMPVDPAAGRKDYHLSTDLADKAIHWIAAEKSTTPDRPFFMYWATGAVHSPHHAPPEYIAKYKGRFDMGWDKAREMILARQIKLGIMPEGTQLPERPAELPAWDSLSPDAKRMAAREMEVFAAQLDHADHEFNRILETLERTGQLDNTIVVVLSDNGASAEGAPNGTDNEVKYMNGRFPSTPELLKHYDDWGSAKYYVHYSAAWALAGNTPMNYYKQTVYGGGVRDPLIISWPAHLKENGQIRTQFQHVTDIAPTLLSLIGIEPPEAVDGVKQQRFDGVDLSNTFDDPKAPSRKTVQYFEMRGSRGIWSNGWKAATLSTTTPWLDGRDVSDDHWQLFHVDTDFNERVDLSKENPQKLAEMKKLFDQEARRNNVYPIYPPLDRQNHTVGLHEAALQANKGQFIFYGPGGYRIPDETAPPFATYSHRITAEIEIPKSGAEGVIAAFGGRTGGFSLYVIDGKPAYAYNFYGDQTITLKGSRLKPGKHKLVLSYDKTGDTAKAQLSVDDAAVANADLPGPASRTLGLNENFAIGMDPGSPVSDEYQSSFAFNGTIERVIVDVVRP